MALALGSKNTCVLDLSRGTSRGYKLILKLCTATMLILQMRIPYERDSTFISTVGKIY